MAKRGKAVHVPPQFTRRFGLISLIPGFDSENLIVGHSREKPAPSLPSRQALSPPKGGNPVFSGLTWTAACGGVTAMGIFISPGAPKREGRRPGATDGDHMLSPKVFTNIEYISLGENKSSARKNGPGEAGERKMLRNEERNWNVIWNQQNGLARTQFRSQFWAVLCLKMPRIGRFSSTSDIFSG